MGEAKRRKETGAPPPRKAKSNKPLYAGIGLLVLAAVLLGVFFLTAAPEPTSDDLPVAAPNADDFPAQLDQYGVSLVPRLWQFLLSQQEVEGRVCGGGQGSLRLL